ncbi:T9SS type A sorting domain-containing protein [Flammeovirga sp. MY04]|uniref:T9SS type A sorting domain-containing protein n=1 Tax=Flammeovirga sp. MY04 TaxID=1191459 RepID=UPI0008061F4D|nr:T9SS type A sorting domain-containing protein [Flammeovirga sp. MY04]ANQ51278.1 T9SS type A sorting domain-containing protein [Flammeovirga sp. MY04]
MKKFLLLITILFTCNLSLYAALITLPANISSDYVIKSTDNGLHKSLGDVRLDNTGGNNPLLDVRLDYVYDAIDPSNSDYVVVAGDLYIDANTEIDIEQGVLFIVEGDVYVTGDITFKNQGYFVVMGSVVGTGNVNTGTGSIALPAYIGGSFDPNVTVTGTGSIDTPLNIGEADVRSILDYEVTNWETDLPVELISFTSKINNNNVELNWSTATEINASHFDIEKSFDKNDWQKIGTVEAHGNSNTLKEYEFTDDNTVQSVVYYRLVQIDFDGQSEIFGPLQVSLNVPFMDLAIFPNPSSEKVNLQINGLSLSTELEITVLDKLGRVVFKDAFISDENAMLYDLNSKANLNTGKYFIHIKSGNQTKTSRFIIQ